MMPVQKFPLPSLTKVRARALRRHATDAENKLWLHLRSGRLSGFKFRRQHPFPPYIADFYCEAAKRIVEVDGSQHDEESDATRTAKLEESGMKILRFWNNEVLQDIGSVLAVILQAAEERTLTPTLSHRERELDGVVYE